MGDTAVHRGGLPRLVIPPPGGRSPVSPVPSYILTRDTLSPFAYPQAGDSTRLYSANSTSKKIQRGQVTGQRLADAQGNMDVLRSRRYWKKWGNQAASDLMRQCAGSLRYEQQLVYSARLGTTTSRRPSCSSTETNLSLLTCSMPDASFVKQPERRARNTRRKPPRNSQPSTRPPSSRIKPDWERLVRQSTGGVLGRMLASTESSGYQTQSGGGGMLLQRRAAIMAYLDEDEWLLLQQTAFTRGLAGGGTRNLKSANSKSMPNIARAVYLDTHPRQYDFQPNSNDGDGFSSVSTSLERPVTSPSLKVCHIHRWNRPQSAPGRLALPKPVQQNKQLIRTRMSISGATSRCQTAPAHVRVRTGQRTHNTVRALQRLTGQGDPKHLLPNNHPDQKRFTASDYAHHPRYPQHVRIAPQLTQVIVSDVKKRMGRPRHHAVTKADIQVSQSK